MIVTNNKLIDKVYWGNDKISSVYKGINRIWPTEVNGVYLTQGESDPDKIINGDVLNEELKQVILNTRWVVGKLIDEGMLVCQVGDKVINLHDMSTNTPDTFYNGASLKTSLSSMAYKVYGDKFIQLPNFSVINDIINENQCQLKWVYGTELPGWINWTNDWLMGLSSCSFENGKFFCHEDVHDVWNTFSYWREKLALINDPRFSFANYWQRCVLTYLYYSIYGTTRDVLTGSPHYFLGIDAFCSSWHEFMDGIVVNNRVPYITMPDGSIRIGPKLPNTSGWISKLHFTPYLDIIPSELNGTKDSYYCSHAWTSDLMGAIPRLKGGMSTDGEVIGCGYDRTDTDGVAKAAVRLTYHGKIIETRDVEYFKRVKPINGGVWFNDETGKDEIYIPEQ